MEVLSKIELPRVPELIVGAENASDAAVYKLSEDTALVASVDFFTPIVDDPYLFGQIAAANSLSDLYAMGARPILALNIVGFPKKGLELSVLERILRGGAEKVREAGAALGGGHTVDDPEVKYGLSVIGLVSPKRLVTNRGAKPGDKLILTKPLGTGILSTALKGGVIGPSSSAFEELVATMTQLNKAASEAMMEVGVSAATDITGFGLVGHALEMAEASGVSIRIKAEAVPVLPGVLDLVRLGMVPAGDFANKKFCEKKVKVEGVDEALLVVLYDAQTSGGLLLSVPSEKTDALLELLKAKGVRSAALIGEVAEDGPPVVIS